MRYFDFHTHAFVDSIAERAMASLTSTAEHSEDTQNIKPHTDGTLSGLRNLMDRCGITRTMILPVATKPTQQTAINNWASGIMDNSIFCCGSVHPDAEDAVAEVERISRLGLYGIKFHSEYQNFRPDEERMMPIYRKASELGLIVVFHGGWDPFGKGEILAVPRSFANIAEKFPDLKIVVAHLGGMKLFDEVEDCIAGKFGNIYLDTGILADFIEPEQLIRIIQKHGAEKILFGSDAPWDNPLKEIQMINNLPLTDDERRKIFYQNAEKLLKKADS
ncbi:MAG: amidohydrolase family protein [Ruminococcus sp.]|nr:amidohydrolase family protein [Ruminococcus sp.]MDE7226534.1 amidohydrolase family protein [Ruminococcus sp.]